MKYKAKHIAEYALLRILVAILLVLPYRLALLFAWINARLFYYILRSRVREARRRIRSVFGNRFSKSEIKSIAWKSWRNIVFTGVEMVRAPELSEEQIESFFDCRETMAIIRDHANTGAGGIVALPHMGSWEMAVRAFLVKDVNIFGITAEQSNPLTSEYINKMRRQLVSETMNRGTSSTLRHILKLLKKGNFLGILPDVRVRYNGIQAPFLGGTASIGKGMASFARHANMPIFPCVLRRDGWGRHKANIFDPIWPDKDLAKDKDLERMTNEVLKIFSDAIMADPAQWFWYNKRWILDPLHPASRPGAWTQTKYRKREET